ncbi:MAG: amino acid permease [Proteobacteria bacterium]|nr:amino acid permease [Pseudomonadota bacterium]
MDEADIGAGEAGLTRGLTKAQAVMIGLGGAIGTGLFLGSGLAIGLAGPAVLVSYLLAGFVALVMVFSLSEMAVLHPAAGSFGVYAEAYLNPWAGFLARTTYWMAQVVAIGGEAIAAGIYMQYWFPGSPVWLWSLGFACALLWVNLRSVSNFGSFEYWFAMIKVAAIIGFIVLGLGAVFGLTGPAIGLANLYALPGGFAPHGLSGIWLGMTVGLFSFVGIEIIAVTSGEVQDPRTAIPAALRTMILRLFLFYVLALAIVVAFVPWTRIGGETVAQSPFVTVLEYSGVHTAAGIMNFVVLVAALSSMNANTYLTSRMLFSLARGGLAPRSFGQLSDQGAPRSATLFSGACILAAAAVSRLTPQAYSYILYVATSGIILVWLTVLASHLAFRRHHGSGDLPVRMPGFPVVQLVAMALLVGCFFTINRQTVAFVAISAWLLITTLAYLLRHRLGARHDA